MRNKSIIVRILTTLMIFTGISIMSYQYFERILVEQEKDQLKVTAQVAANYLENDFQSQMNEMDDLFYTAKDLSDDDFKELLKKYTEQQNDGNKVVFKEDEDAIETKTKMVGWELIKEEHLYQMFIEKSIQNKGIVRLIIDMNQVYENLLSPIQLGKYGYTSLKDDQGFILMHNAISQIGVDSNQERKDNYQKIDHTQIDELLSNQYNDQVGCDLITSYWWNHMEEGLVKKFIAYAPVMIDGQYFVVNVVSGYQEVTTPLFHFLIFLAVSSIIFVIIIGTWIFRYMKKQQEAQRLEQELKYTTSMQKINERLSKQQIEFEKYNRLSTLGTYASCVQHEFKNMLTPIYMYSELLDKKLKNHTEYSVISEALLESVTMCKSISSSMFQYGKQTKEKKWNPVNVEEVLNLLEKMILPSLPIHIHWMIDIKVQPIVIYGDEQALLQILLNLVNNAIYAMKTEGELKINVFKNEEKLFIEMIDQGGGMNDEVLSKIFEPFYTTKSSNDGTGLGLAVVRQLMIELQGGIEVTSKLNEGTTFTLTFPCNS